ncbi:short transient receptor potential channel 4-like isoform X2 [Acropora millepora]|uniref:short transient receptor potential channel 4-like isoform X2 n=1 Tax=Acropora millepora TaxID=45264 RepID=UPI001CF0EC24|nr:short transient receptor potential channel 4-like isoform X2 [Acropora millepora]
MESTSILLQTIEEDDIHPRNKKCERSLRDAIREQDLAKFRTVLSTPVSSSDLDYVNSCGKTLLQEAVNICDESIRSEIIKALLSNGADLQFALLHAVRNDDANTVEILLKYRHDYASEVPSKVLNREYLTPLILAAWLQNYEVVKLLLDSGFTITSPSKGHRSAASMKMPNEKLASAVQRLNTYRGLASPVYIAASFLQNLENGPDPVYRACVLNKEIRDTAREEYEFSTEYEELSDNCKEFAVALLNECRSMKEIRCIMETNTEQATSLIEEGRFSMLEFAIKTKNDKFVSHPYSQLLLNAEVYKDATFLEKSTWKQALVILLSATLYPVFFMVWLFSESCFPNHKVTKVFHAPVVKFLINCGLYQTFIFLLVITAAYSNFSRSSTYDWFILLFVIGFVVEVVKDLYQFGRRRFFSDTFNCMAVAIVTFFIPHYIIWWVTAREILSDGVKTKEEFLEHPSHEGLLISEGFISVGVLLAFFYNLSFMQANPSIGPLLRAFVEMLIDVAKFFLYFFFIFLAFAVSFTKLYTQYLAGIRSFTQNQGNSTIGRDALISTEVSFSGTFWALFGQIDLDHLHAKEKGFEPITYAAVIIFGVFNVAAVLVALNMLIAILNDAYTKISKRRLTKNSRREGREINSIKEKERRKVIRRLVLRYLRQKGTGNESSEAEKDDCEKTAR